MLIFTMFLIISFYGSLCPLVSKKSSLSEQICLLIDWEHWKIYLVKKTQKVAFFLSGSLNLQRRLYSMLQWEEVIIIFSIHHPIIQIILPKRVLNKTRKIYIC